MESPIAQTTAGRVRGTTSDGVHIYKGVPYGGATGGLRRFLPAAPADPWDGVRDATLYGSACPQPPRDPAMQQQMLASGFIFEQEQQGEDCLVLNVWTNGVADGGRRPVMVWLHGGAWEFGSGAGLRCDGEMLARRDDVVVVTVNHRLSIFGHLYLGDAFGADYATSANAGVLDIVLALHWIRENIAAFGGDPANVTLFGESGGGSKIWTLLAMPGAKGLFQRAILISGYLMWPRVTREDASRYAEAALRDLGVNAGDVEALARVPAERLLQTSTAVTAAMIAEDAPLLTFPNTTVFTPAIDGMTLFDQPTEAIAGGSAKEIGLMLGCSRNDHFNASRFAGDFGWIDDDELAAVLRPMLGERAGGVVDAYRRGRPGASASALFAFISTDLEWRIPALRVAEAQIRSNGIAPYIYYCALDVGLPTPLAFNNVHQPMLARTAVRGTVGQVHPAFVNFARSGNPNHPDMPDWRPYSFSNRPTMVWDYESRMVDDPAAGERAIWDGIR